MAGIAEQARKLDLKNAVITSVIASLGFVTALFWRDAIRDTIDLLIPEGEGLFYAYLVALATTALVIVVVYVLIKLQETSIKQTFKNRLKQTIKK